MSIKTSVTWDDYFYSVHIKADQGKGFLMAGFETKDAANKMAKHVETLSEGQLAMFLEASSNTQRAIIRGFSSQKVPKNVATKGTKHDSDKTPLELLPLDALVEVGKVLKFGAENTSLAIGKRVSALADCLGRLCGTCSHGSTAKTKTQKPAYSTLHTPHVACCLSCHCRYAAKPNVTTARSCDAMSQG
jgi:hypothetical protein